MNGWDGNKAKPKTLTEADLRSNIHLTDCKEYTVASDVFVTPAAKEYLCKQGIRLIVREQPGFETMPRTPITAKGDATYVDAATGQGYAEKPEHMTHLYGNVLVSKTHPRILFRGKLDSLQAEILMLQVKAAAENRQSLVLALEDLLGLAKKLLGAEVKNQTLGEFRLFEMDARELRHVSHHVDAVLGISHPVPDHRMGELAIGLNRLRTLVRETELAAAAAFPEERPDLIEALNRMSSGVYILFCSCVANKN